MQKKQPESDYYASDNFESYEESKNLSKNNAKKSSVPNSKGTTKQ